ncbi:hypothetical protein PL321_01950 [Caloramator sp. mosi_1]|uniref:hypothetical protein n=1 Tax=Caloramator sp. mosi_1 TaxID=3023090 RepID=UPI00235FC08D|nr:hypothetical protein [Caloramator sp. mosi_1]WDC84534.1 hypothetical protein PL321_01950 [Caloramator sp. mosi_1]
MLNERQRNFRKQIKELEKEGLIEKRKQGSRRNYSLLGVVLLMWNIFAIYTWIRPLFVSKVTKVAPVSNLGYRMIKGEYNQEKIANYIINHKKIIELKKENMELIKQYLDGNIKLDENNIKANLAEMVTISKSNIVTVDDLKYLDELINQDILNHSNLVNYLLENKKLKSKSYDLINYYINNSNDLNLKIRTEIINVFKNNNIDYSIDPETNEIRFTYKIIR